MAPFSIICNFAFMSKFNQSKYIFRWFSFYFGSNTLHGYKLYPSTIHLNTLTKCIRSFCLCTSSTLNFQCSNFSTTTIYLKKRKTAEEKKQLDMLHYSPKPKRKMDVITVWRNMTVQQLASAMGKEIDHVFEVMLYVDNSYDYDEPNKCIDNVKVIQDIVKKSGMRCQIGSPPSHKHHHSKEIKDAVKRPPADPKNCTPRHPVVTVMGHVDHGKTTLLDSLRHTHVVDQEFGGITQHIGAFEVCLENGEMITFLDTPGHAAFTAMRSRGAHVTDIVVLVVAADDGVMEQTIESVRLAQEANVPIIVAINKIDKPEADVERTKKMLTSHSLVPEDYGGDVQVVPISALKGIGLSQLAETISTQAAMLELKADPKGLVEATVIESRTDPYRGKLSTAIIQRGTLRKGSFLVSGTAWAKVRAMFNDKGQPIQEAPPSTPVEIIGWKDLPNAGDLILEVETERRAHEVIQFRQTNKQVERLEEDYVAIQHKVEEHLKEYKEQLEERRRLGRRKFKMPIKAKSILDEDKGPKLSVLIKGDVDGSVEAILDVLESYHSPQCRLDLIHYGVGTVTEHDIKLAEPFKGIIYAFNVDMATGVEEAAKSHHVVVKKHNIIYRLIDDLKEELSQRLPLKDEEEFIGEANVLQEFIITEGKHKVPVAGCRCVKGMLKKNALFRLIRGEEILFQGRVTSIRHLKNEVDTIKKDVECGIRLSDESLHLQPGDTIICYQMKQVPQVTDWDPGF